MISKGERKGTIRFETKPAAQAKEVLLAGTFTSWKPTPMRRTKDGVFMTVVPLPRGEHQYKFVVDGQWVADRDNTQWIPNPYGSFNSVVKVD